jgi:L-fuconolactonase
MWTEITRPKYERKGLGARAAGLSSLDRLAIDNARRGALLAECPNVNLKLGGIGMPRLGFDWHARARPTGSEELAAAIAPITSYCIEQFGPDRCMFESNFPVDKVSFSHHVLFNAFKLFSKSYSTSERAALLHDTAVRAYRINEVG